MFGPVKVAAVHDYSAKGVAVTGAVLGQRVNHNVGTEADRFAQRRAGNGVVHDQRNTVSVGHFGQCFKINYVSCRITDGFAVDRLGPFIDLSLDILR